MEDFATAVWPEQPVPSPAKGRRGVRPRPRATADAPTEITGAPTTPLPPAQAKRRSRAPAVIGLAVAVAGVGTYAILGRTGNGEPGAAPGADSTARRSPLPAPVIDTVRIQDTVRVPVQASRPPQRRVERFKPPATRPIAEASGQGFLTIAADPFGEVYVDGVDAGQTPLVEYAVKPGRHAIRIEHAGFKTVTETVQVDASNTVRKRYTLLPE